MIKSFLVRLFKKISKELENYWKLGKEVREDSVSFFIES